MEVREKRDMGITPNFIHDEIEKQSYELSLHADNERIAQDLTIFQLEFALSDCRILEEYPDDPRGESCLVAGFTSEGNSGSYRLWEESFRTSHFDYGLHPSYAKMEGSVHKEPIIGVSVHGKRIQ
jgi:hypothetical protein